MTFQITGKFELTVEDRGFVVARRCFSNGITQTAINSMWDTWFRNGSPAAAWYIGLIDDTDYSAVDDEDDTIASHSGWTEINADYDEATRPAWGPDAAASQAIANSLKATFTFNAAKDVRGAFVVNENTKGGSSGLLWNTGILDIKQSVVSGQTVKVYYALTGQEG
jgi:hypothetical protein